jgi:hypothetical protein
MRAYIPVAAKPGLRQQWVVLSIDEDRRCEAFEVHDSLAACLAEVDRLNDLMLREAAPRKQRAASP